MTSPAWTDEDDERRQFSRINSLLMRFRVQDGETPEKQMLVFC